MPSILRSFKAPRVPRLPTSQKTAAIKDLGHQNYETGRQFSALLPAVFFFVAWGEKARAGIDHTPRRQRKPVLLVLLASALRRLLPIGRTLVAQAPHVCCDRGSLVGRQLRAPHCGHRAAILLWLRHTLNYRFLDSGIAAIARQPVLSRKSRTQRRSLAALAMTPCTRRAADLTTINAFTERHHFSRRAFRNG